MASQADHSTSPMELRLIYGDGTLGVGGSAFHYIFNYSRGGLESLSLAGKEWLYREPQPAFWRATTDNDRGNGFSKRSAQWVGADQFRDVERIELAVDGTPMDLPTPPQNNRYGGAVHAHQVTIAFTYRTVTIPSTTISVAYTVDGQGVIHVQVHYVGRQGLPELPVCGLRFIMPTLADGFVYEGLSGETYPDRMAGGRRGTHAVDGLPVTPYMVPQDCGMHMDTTRVTVTRSSVKNNADRSHDPFSLTVRSTQRPFAFSCLPYTPEELENATHIEELPLPRRTVLSVFGAVRGVGGIDSWGQDVEPAYHVSAQEDIEYSFDIIGGGASTTSD